MLLKNIMKFQVCISSKLHYEFIENNLNDVSINEGGNTDFIKKLINKSKYKNKTKNTVLFQI